MSDGVAMSSHSPCACAAFARHFRSLTEDEKTPGNPGAQGIEVANHARGGSAEQTRTMCFRDLTDDPEYSKRDISDMKMYKFKQMDDDLVVLTAYSYDVAGHAWRTRDDDRDDQHLSMRGMSRVHTRVQYTLRVSADFVADYKPLTDEAKAKRALKLEDAAKKVAQDTAAAHNALLGFPRQETEAMSAYDGDPNFRPYRDLSVEPALFTKYVRDVSVYGLHVVAVMM